MSVELPTEKKVRLINQSYKFENRKICLIREFAQFSSLVASCPGIEYGMIHSKSLEKAKLEELDENYTDFDKKMKIPTYIKEDINW